MNFKQLMFVTLLDKSSRRGCLKKPKKATARHSQKPGGCCITGMMKNQEIQLDYTVYGSGYKLKLPMEQGVRNWNYAAHFEKICGRFPFKDTSALKHSGRFKSLREIPVLSVSPCPAHFAG